IQMRQNAWSDRLSQLRQELDNQRAASEAERTALMQEQHKKLMEVTEEWKVALQARDDAESQLKLQADGHSLQLAQVREDAARQIEKAARQEKQRLERQQWEFEKTLRQHDEDA